MPAQFVNTVHVPASRPADCYSGRIHSRDHSCTCIGFREMLASAVHQANTFARFDKAPTSIACCSRHNSVLDFGINRSSDCQLLSRWFHQQRPLPSVQQSGRRIPRKFCNCLLTSIKGAKWVSIAAFDVVTELQLMALPVALVWPLQLRTKTKVEVVSAFLFRAMYVRLAEDKILKPDY